MLPRIDPGKGIGCVLSRMIKIKIFIELSNRREVLSGYGLDFWMNDK